LGEALVSAQPPDSPSAAELGPGVRELDHTADVGIEISAAGPEELFRRAALGMARLMRGHQATAAGAVTADQRALTLEARSLERLLVSWLSELLYLDEVDGFVFEDATFDKLEPGRLCATVSGRIEPDLPERQLKGVTYHALRLGPVSGGWRARLIFDI
jgi:SHS2 domain-containing protein